MTYYIDKLKQLDSLDQELDTRGFNILCAEGFIAGFNLGHSSLAWRIGNGIENKLNRNQA